MTTNDRPKSFDEKPPIRLCGLCRGKGHFKNNCPQNPKYVHTISLTFFFCLVNTLQNFDVCYNLSMQEHGMMIIAKDCLNKKNNFCLQLMIYFVVLKNSTYIFVSVHRYGRPVISVYLCHICWHYTRCS